MSVRMGRLSLFLLGCISCGILPGKGGPTDGETSDSGAGGGGIEPSQSCLDYIACADAAGIADLELIEAAYGPESTCWADAISALACSQACAGSIDAQEVIDPTITECWGEAPPSTDLLFNEIGEEWIVDEADPGCQGLVGGAVVLEGTSEATFETFVYDPFYEGFPVAAVACTLAVDRTFDCPDGYGIVGDATATGNFTAPFAKMNLALEIPDLPLTCELSITPL